MTSPTENPPNTDLEFTSIHGVILLETLNEPRSIAPVLEEICEAIDVLHRFTHRFSILIIDDSDDDSVALIGRRCAAAWGIAIEVLKGRRRGLGSAIAMGLSHAVRELGADLVVNLDADGQHDARQIPDLLRIHCATDADLTIGSRWIRGGEAYGLGAIRTLISKSSSLLLRATSIPWSIKDPTTSFRVYSKKVIESSIRESLGYDGYAFIPMIAATASSMGFKIVEVPIKFRPRIAGISKLKARQMSDAIRDLPRIRARKKMIERRQVYPFMRGSNAPESFGESTYQATDVLEHLASSEKTARRWCKLFLNDLGDRPLEVGAGLGQNSRVIAGTGKDLTAIEPDRLLYARLSHNLSDSPRIKVINTDINGLINGQEDGKFTSAVYVNVLEHIDDDLGEIQSLSSVLAPGGRVVIFSPALPSLYSSLDGSSAHFRRYTRRELRSLLENSGFDVECLEYHDQLGAFLYWLMYRILRLKSAQSSSVFLYDNLVLPTSSALTRLFGTNLPGKNLLAVGVLRSS